MNDLLKFHLNGDSVQLQHMHHFHCDEDKNHFDILPLVTDYDEIDKQIIERIENLTAADNQIWNSTDGKNYQFAHGLFQYPAMMVPVVQKKIIEIIKNAAPQIDSMIDPFMGSSTSLIAGMQLGLNCYGQDINPLAILLSKVKTNTIPFTNFELSKENLLNAITDDPSSALECLEFNVGKWFKHGVALQIGKIARGIKTESDLSTRQFYWIVLAETIRLTSNDRTSTFKLHIRSAENLESWNPSPVAIFTELLDSSIEKLNVLYRLLKNSGYLNNDNIYIREVFTGFGDTSKSLSFPGTNQFPLLVTSPPYGDNRTTVPYGQHSYLALQWIDPKDIGINVEYLQGLSMYSIDNKSLGGTLKGKPYQEFLEVLLKVSINFRKDYTEKFANLNSPLKNKIVVFLYDLYKSVENANSSLLVNGYSVWTIGNRNVGGEIVRNNAYLIDFLTYLNSKFITTITREIFNKRMPKKNDRASLMNFEDIIIFRKLDGKER